MSLRKRSVNFKKEDNGSSSPYKKQEKQEEDDQQSDNAITSFNMKPSSRIDKILQAYEAFTSNSYNHDKILKTVQYSLWMLSRFYRNTARNSLVKLSGEVSWARYINRFLGLPAALAATKSGSWGSPPNGHWASSRTAVI